MPATLGLAEEAVNNRSPSAGCEAAGRRGRLCPSGRRRHVSLWNAVGKNHGRQSHSSRCEQEKDWPSARPTASKDKRHLDAASWPWLALTRQRKQGRRVPRSTIPKRWHKLGKHRAGFGGAKRGHGAGAIDKILGLCYI